MRSGLLAVAVAAAVAFACTDQARDVTSSSNLGLQSAHDSGGGGGSGAARAGGPVALVDVVPDSQIINLGDTAGVLARLFNRAGRELFGRAVAFTTSDSRIVRLEAAFGQNAILRGVGRGTAIVTATSEGVSGIGLVVVRTVTPPPDTLPPPPPPPDTLPPPPPPPDTTRATVEFNR